MRIQLPQQTLTRPLHLVKPLTVIRHNRECFIVTGAADHDVDFNTGEADANPDIMCLNIHTGALEPISGRVEVELLESDLTVRDAVRVPMQGGEQVPHYEHLPLTRAELAEIHAGRKIQAIKLVRERTRLGLKEAKDIVDAESLRLGV